MTWPPPAAIRVCHVMSADLWAGAEVQVATVASHLMRRPDVVLTAALFNDGPLAVELNRLGVPVTVIDEHANRAPRIVQRLARHLRAHAVDIVHTHRYKDTLLGALAAGVAGVPFLVRTVHGRPEQFRGLASMRFKAYNTIDRAVLRWFADGMIAVSSSVADTLTPIGGRYAPVVRLPNGVNLERVRPVRDRLGVRLTLDSSPDRPLIGTVGRLSPVKGHKHFLEAARHILDIEPHARFVVIGDGELRSELSALAVRLGLEGRCQFLGARPDVYDLVSALDVFVLPSLDEGTPMALLEAMALRTPVVASAVGGVPDVVTDGATGLLVGPADAAALATACLTIVNDSALARSLADRARQLVETDFSHVTNGNRLVEVYRGVMARGPVGTIRSRLRERIDATTERAQPSRTLATRAVQSLRRRVAHARARRREDQHRQDPARPLASLRAAKSILILCHGNIIRSPFAAHLIAGALGPVTDVTVKSAGLEAVPGRPSPPAPVVAADSFCVDLRQHSANVVTPQAVAAADVIFVMDLQQLATMRQRFPTASPKTFLLTCLATDTPLEVRDPVMGGESVCRTCFEHIAKATLPVVAALRRQ